jgi:hypothetical protein
MIVVRGERMPEDEPAVLALDHITGELLEALVEIGVVPDLVLLLGAGPFRHK